MTKADARANDTGSVGATPYHDRWMIAIVRVGKEPPFQQSDAKRREVPGRRRNSGCLVADRIALSECEENSTFPGRQARANADGPDARQVTNAFEDTVGECDPSCQRARGVADVVAKHVQHATAQFKSFA